MSLTVNNSATVFTLTMLLSFIIWPYSFAQAIVDAEADRAGKSCCPLYIVATVAHSTLTVRFAVADREEEEKMKSLAEKPDNNPPLQHAGSAFGRSRLQICSGGLIDVTMKAANETFRMTLRKNIEQQRRRFSAGSDGINVARSRPLPSFTDLKEATSP